MSAIPYPYAFNGKRMENVELYTSNQYDYGMRYYDARTGRFYSVDPLTAKYPELTPYQFASNTPIQASDIDGLEADFSKAKINKLIYTAGSVWNPASNAKKVGIFIDNSVISAYNSVIDATELSYNYIFYHKQTSETVQKDILNATFKGLIYLGNTTKEQRWLDVKSYAKDKLSDVNTYENLAGQLMLAKGLGIVGENVSGLRLQNFKDGLTGLSVETPYGSAIQSLTKEALTVRAQVEQGGELYRIGELGKQEASGGQFWSTENPLINPRAYEIKYGLEPGSLGKKNFVEIGKLKPNTQFITRPAPAYPGSPSGYGGGIEVVTPLNGVKLESFHVFK